jgi:hypothetical protein
MAVQELAYAGPAVAAALLVSVLSGRGRVGFFNVLRTWVCGRTEIAIQKERTRALLSVLDRLPPGGMVTDGRTGLLITIPAGVDGRTVEIPERGHYMPEAPESR